jgi:hypothetical protein
MNDIVEHNGKTYAVRYAHERIFCACGEIAPRGGRTVAMVDLLFDEGGYAMAGLAARAECSTHDIYSKHKGREIAKGRLIQLLKKLDGVV